MSVTAGTILRVVVSNIWTDGEIAQNVYNAVVTGGGSPFDNDDIVQDAVSWAEDMYYNLTNSISDELDGSQVQVYEYDSVDDDWDEVGSSAFFWNPTDTGDQLPRGNAMLVNLKTTDPDVSGKKYLPGIAKSGIVDGILNAGILALVASYAVDWYDGFVGTDSGADWQPGVWSPTDTVFRSAGTTVIIPTIVAYQRRRKRGIGI